MVAAFAAQKVRELVEQAHAGRHHVADSSLTESCNTSFSELSLGSSNTIQSLQR
ncbi:hypothetical protein HBI09_165520 [Parastagonospora nodorum]|nr:hypothetical protein HBI09_165520 [Parastagonospora nodorum]KAH5005663.1 hypothetical protein HBI77_114180 [Parastagonospora nodorum]